MSPRVWLVTDCSRGLGREIALAVLAAGHRLIATARNPRDLDFLEPSDRLRAVALDVTDGGQARAVVADATAAFGGLDVVVNNAGIIKADSVEDLPEEEFRRQIEINFFGVYNVTRAALPVMHAQRDGHIIQISSIGGRRGSPGLGAYQSAKWAVGGFSEVLAREVGPLGIRVTCVEPGGMRTDMFGLSMLADRLSPDYEGTVGAGIRATFGDPGRARNDPAKVAQAILRLPRRSSPPSTCFLDRTRWRWRPSRRQSARKKTPSGGRSASPRLLIASAIVAAGRQSVGPAPGRAHDVAVRHRPGGSPRWNEGRGRSRRARGRRRPRRVQSTRPAA